MEKIKNYKCRITGKTGINNEDNNCEIFSLPDFETTKKSIKYSRVQKANDLVNKNTLITDKYFKLKVNKNNLSSLDWSSNAEKSIDIVSTNENEANKTYATLKLLIQDENKWISGKTNLFLGLVESKTIKNEFAGHIKCKFEDYLAQQDCKIYAINNNNSIVDNYEDLNFSNVVQKDFLNQISEKSLLLIDIKDKKYEISNLSKKVKIFYSNLQNNFLELKILSPVLGSVSTSGNNNKILFLK